jgi:hypothetical protein
VSNENSNLQTTTFARDIITSRLLILQSKRLVLRCKQKWLDTTGAEWLRLEVERLCLEAEDAQHRYRISMLAWGSPEFHDYWLIAYARLIEVGSVLTTRLREATTQLPLSERYQVSADVEMLEGIVNNWTESLREEMAAAVA